ncbi:DUF2501 domain-containing protein [Schauerella aestuarii]|uniref:DUF2501 domain-containing protein n=1 Tax=Schauerella aestuarii TaxID=2511204 RepID=UPI00136E2BF7|nr:DUF2501 domain-containing protein [Achromobacter aestuarii]MYZ44707.1 DUF2501 domain-containing protein [Achromobacter aestuarii]
MRKSLNAIAIAAATVSFLPSGVAHAQLMDAVKGQLGGLGQGGTAGSSTNASGLGGMSMSSLTSGSMGNVAGVLEFCMKNNYLNANAAAGVKDKLLGKLSGATPEAKKSDTGYMAGLGGLLTGKDGQNVDLKGGGLKQELTKKACDQVLKQGKSLM